MRDAWKAMVILRGSSTPPLLSPPPPCCVWLTRPALRVCNRLLVGFFLELNPSMTHRVTLIPVDGIGLASALAMAGFAVGEGFVP
jgi:hypothetical protein